MQIECQVIIKMKCTYAALYRGPVTDARYSILLLIHLSSFYDFLLKNYYLYSKNVWWLRSAVEAIDKTIAPVLTSGAGGTTCTRSEYDIV